MNRDRKQFRWYMRGLRNGRVVTLGGFMTEDEANQAGLKLSGFYEVQLLPTVNLNEASRMFRASMFNDAQSQDIDNVFKRFSHKE